MNHLLSMACVCTVAEIEQFCGGVNAPGLDRVLHMTCEDQVDAIPDLDTGTHTISEDMEMRAAVVGPPAVDAGVFYPWYFSKEDMSYTSTRDENGEWTTEVKIFMLQLNSEKTFVLNGMTGDNGIAIVKDRNGQPRLIGAIGNGCSISVKEQTNPKNGYEVTINWKSAHAPYYYTGAITV